MRPDSTKHVSNDSGIQHFKSRDNTTDITLNPGGKYKHLAEKNDKKKLTKELLVDKNTQCVRSYGNHDVPFATSAVFPAGITTEQIANALTETFLEVGKKFFKADGANNIYGGSTATMTIVYNNNIINANVGDSQTFLLYAISPNKHALLKITRDQSATIPHNPDIKAIRNAGGQVEGGRVNFMLEPTRAFGDHDVFSDIAKKYIPYTPEIWGTQVKGDCLLIAVSDGITEKQVADAIFEQGYALSPKMPLYTGKLNQQFDTAQSKAEYLSSYRDKCEEDIDYRDNLGVVVANISANNAPLIVGVLDGHVARQDFAAGDKILSWELSQALQETFAQKISAKHLQYMQKQNTLTNTESHSERKKNRP